MMLTPGAMLLGAREALRGGVRATWYRERVRPQILKTSPVRDLNDTQCELHVLTSARDWLDLMWGLKSFYRASGTRYRLCVHDDGSLDHVAKAAFATHFPDGRVIDRRQADQHMASALAHFPHTRGFRATNVLAIKSTDFYAFLEGERMLLFDSDLLFFGMPMALVERIEDPCFASNAFNADVVSAYVITAEDARAKFDIDLLPRINSGLGALQGDLMRYDWLEEFLSVESVRTGHFWRIEQTLFALSASRYAAELLPEEYTLTLTPGINGRPFRHYVGAIRQLMYREGMRELVRGGLLSEV